jgi:hypothetical protein
VKRFIAAVHLSSRERAFRVIAIKFVTVFNRCGVFSYESTLDNHLPKVFFSGGKSKRLLNEMQASVFQKENIRPDTFVGKYLLPSMFDLGISS